jgi:hypothetical protein
MHVLLVYGDRMRSQDRGTRIDTGARGKTRLAAALRIGNKALA